MTAAANSGRMSPEAQLILLRKGFLRSFFVLIKSTQHYPGGHRMIARASADLREAVANLAKRHEDSSLSLSDSHLFVGEHRLRPDAAGFETFLTVVETMRTLDVGTIHFNPGCTAADLQRWAELCSDLGRIDRERIFQALRIKMGDLGITGVEIERTPEQSLSGERDFRDRKERAKHLYAKSIEVSAEVIHDLDAGRSPGLKKSRRVVQGMIDMVMSGGSTLLGLTSIRCYDEYTYNHSVNVCILALTVGHRSGLEKRRLVDLGMAALFHDIGKSRIPKEILNKPSAFNDEEWEEMHRHPLYGVLGILELKGIGAMTARIMQGTFEHHLGYDLSGYPALSGTHEQSLFGRIIALADFYDAVSSSRVYNRTANPPDETLRCMVSKQGTAFDPLLLKVFVNCIGVYPIGSLCLLDSGEMAVVIENSTNPEEWMSPTVRLVTGGGEDAPADGSVNLASAGEQRKIVSTVDAVRHGVDVSRYFL